MVVPEVGDHQVEVGRVAELALVVDYQNQLGVEANDINKLAIEQLVQLGQLEAASVTGLTGWGWALYGSSKLPHRGLLVSNSGGKHDGADFMGPPGLTAPGE